MPNIHHSKDYFEAILQIRPKNKEVLDFINKQIEKKENIWIAKQQKLKEGIDLYLSSQRFAISLGRKLKKSFNGIVKITRSLFKKDKQTSKRVYRVTVLFRIKQDIK